jgi:5-deoxy-glucuronate isomerase
VSGALREDRCVVRATGAHKGRTRTVAPANTAARHLHYGRIVLDAGGEPVRFETGEHETALVCLTGSASVTTEGGSFALGRYDSLYVGKGTQVEVWPGFSGCDLAEISAPVAERYPVQFVSWEQVQGDASLRFKAGAPPAERTVNVLIGKNVEAGRLMVGVTFSAPGNWTSWPPHEHARLAEEAYVYIEMPAPAWGVQLVYTDPRSPELAVVVREGDCVLMPEGYHPNVAAPGGTINFLWMMAANREREDRLFGVVNVQSEYAAGGSGLEAGAPKKS